MCSDCRQYATDIEAFKKGYGDGYSASVIEELCQMRQTLCNMKASCTCGSCYAEALINQIDNDPEIRRKKGL